jgi:hypothetical protein
MSAVTVINFFEVPAGREGEFLELRKKVNAYMQRKLGYLGNKLFNVPVWRPARLARSLTAKLPQCQRRKVCNISYESNNSPK